MQNDPHRRTGHVAPYLAFRRVRTAMLALVLAPLSPLIQPAEAARPDDAVIAPRAHRAPAIDGDLTDACWAGTALVDRVTLPEQLTAPSQPLSFRVCYDDSTLYCALVCVEPHPEDLQLRHRADSQDVWQDDSVELFVRARGGRLDYDQFIVNAAGARWSLRHRGGQAEDTPRVWKAAARIGEGEWAVEVALPLACLGLERPRPGQLVELKLGREDHTGPETALSVWPPGTSYGRGQGYGRLYLGDPNLLVNPNLEPRDDGTLEPWTTDEGDGTAYRSVLDDGERLVRVTTAGTPSAVAQSVDLEAETRYLLSARVRGDGRVYLGANTASAQAGDPVPHTVWSQPGPEWRELAVSFATGTVGPTLISIGCPGAAERGVVELRDLRLVQMGRAEASGPAIRVSADGRPVVITEVLVADSRVVRGFVGTPFDGTQRSRNWAGRTWEYPMPGAGAGVGYEYRENDGLHVRLADSVGFDAVQVRGGARSDMHVGPMSYRGPGEAARAHGFGSGGRVSRVHFPERVKADQVSFFNVGDGLMSEVAFLRVEEWVPEAMHALVTWRLGEGVEATEDVVARFSEGDQRCLALLAGSAPEAGSSGTPLLVQAGEAVHLLSPPLEADTPIAAVELRLSLADTDRAGMMVAVQDPIDPRLELMGVDVEVVGRGAMRLVVDFPDQVVPAGTCLWFTLVAEKSLKLVGPNGSGAPEVALHGISREEALPEALAYRTFLLKSLFVCASEARPWTQIGRRTDLEEWFRTGSYGDQVKEVFETVDHLLWLDPDHEIAGQFHQWLWRNRNGLAPFEPRLENPSPGAPEWALWAREAWLAARRVPTWWLDHRLVPTGEFGGVVGDDSDMYQNYVDFAFLESEGLAVRLKEAAARLAELAEVTTLIDGINRQTMDPLHAYEEGLNQEALMAVWHYGDPVYLERCMAAAQSAADLTTVTSAGHRHFRSQRVGADERGVSATDTDGHAHPLMWHPAFEVLWYNHNPKVEEWLRQWADGWLQHMRPGEYATMVKVADESVEATTQRPLYGGYGALGSAFCFLSWITGDGRYVSPFYEAYATGSTATSPGNLVTELLHRYGAAAFGEALPGLLTSSGAAAAVASGYKAPLIAALKEDVAELQRFPIMYTESEPFTDRVFLYAITDAAIAYTGGYATRNKFSRSHAVSWSGFGTEYAALVLAASPDQFRSLVYNFRDVPQEGEARFWSLDHGRYAVEVGVDADADDVADYVIRRDTVEVVRGGPLHLALNPREVSVIELTLVERLDDLTRRPDLALSPLDTQVEARRVSGVVHNLGGAPADCDVAVVDAEGVVLSRRRLGQLEAPLDLKPRRLTFELDLPAGDREGWSLEVDPDDLVAELFEGNNRVRLDQARKVRAMIEEVGGRSD